MYRTASAAAYDVMDSVFVTVRVQTYEPDGEGFEKTESRWVTTVPSTGEADDREWLRDALVGLIEAL